MGEVESSNPLDTWLQSHVSLFANVRVTRPSAEIRVKDYLADISSGRWRESISDIRAAIAEGDKAKADKLKRAKLQAATFSGVFGQRAIAGLLHHSGLLTLDFDDLGKTVVDAKRRLTADSHVLAVFVSPSGNGLKTLVPVVATTPDEHSACFGAAEAHFRAIGFVADPSGKDVSRLCFASWDPECWVAGEDRKVLAFAPPLLSLPEPCTYTLQPTPTLYTTEKEDERVMLARARGEAQRYFSRIEPTSPVQVALYRKILANRAELGLHLRNDWLCATVPFLFRAFSPVVAIELAVLHLKAYGELYSGNEAEHRSSFESLWAGCDKNYPSELSSVELGIYAALEEPERSAFRICRDLARAGKDLTFFLACDHLEKRLAPPGAQNGYRMLRSFESLRILELVKKGFPRTKGQPAPASIYRWALPPFSHRQS